MTVKRSTLPPAGATRGADALVRTLLAAGVRRVFALSGNHVMVVFDALLGSGIELVHVRHEAAAVHMADAWSRVTGEVGVALVTGGPGHANAVGALYTARMAEAPVVLLSGHAPVAQLGLGAFQEMDQAALAAPVTKASWRCAGADAVAADVARAMAVARSGRCGPVHLSLPSDALESRTSGDAVGGDASIAAARADGTSMLLADPDARAILEALARAQRPLVLAGPWACTRSGRAQLAALEQALGVPAIGMESPRGIADPGLGDFGSVLAQADAVLLLGKRVDFTLGFGRSPVFDASCSLVQVDADDDELARSRRALGQRLAVAAKADRRQALAGLLAAAGRKPPRAGRAEAPLRHANRAAWQDEVRGRLAHRPAAWATVASGVRGRLHPVQALRPIQALLDAHPDAVLVCDGGEFGQWAQACLTAPHRVINGVAGSIGSALPYALAARAAVGPEAPVIAVLGDGTFGFHAMEIDTAVRHGLPFVAVVGNDARWNAEYQIQLRTYGPARAHGCELAPSRYDELARALGGHGEHVADADTMAAALRRAAEARVPAVVNVMIEGLAAPISRTVGRSAPVLAHRVPRIDPPHGTPREPMPPFKSIRYAASRPGPRLIVLGAVHGNETCGTRAIERLTGELDAGSLALVAGCLTLVPVTNPMAYAMQRRAGDRNLNRRLAPTDAPREFEDRVANWLCPLLAEHELLLDLHSFSAPGTPFVFIGPSDNDGPLEPFAQAAREEALAQRLGVGRAVDGWLDTYARGVARRREIADRFPAASLDLDPRYGIGTTEYMRSVGGAAVTLECGRHDDPLAPEVAHRAILATLAHLRMIEAADPPPAAMECLRLSEVVDKLDAGDAFVREWKSFDPVAAGETIGRRHDGAAVAAPFTGFIVFPNPGCEPGKEWFYLARPTDRLRRA